MDRILDWASVVVGFAVFIGGMAISGCVEGARQAEAEPVSHWQVSLYSGGHVVRRWSQEREPYKELNTGRIHIGSTMIHGTYVVEKVK